MKFKHVTLLKIYSFTGMMFEIQTMGEIYIYFGLGGWMGGSGQTKQMEDTMDLLSKKRGKLDSIHYFKSNL